MSSDWLALLDAMADSSGAGVPTTRKRAVMSSGVDEENGIVRLHEAIPNEGDSLLVVNCGDHFELRQQSWRSPPFELTHDDIDRLRAGTITFN